MIVMKEYLNILVILDGVKAEELKGYFSQSELSGNVIFRKRCFDDYLKDYSIVIKDCKNFITTSNSIFNKDSILFLENSWLNKNDLPKKFDGFEEYFLSKFTHILLICAYGDTSYYKKLKESNINNVYYIVRDKFYSDFLFTKTVSDVIISFYNSKIDEII